MTARDIPTDELRAIALIDGLLAQFLAPPPRIDTAEWAARYRHIAKGPERGPWRNERTPYLVGEHYSIADIALYAYTHVADEGGFSLQDYPAIRAWLARVASHPRHVAMLD